jgi:hypothetical protein
MTGTWNVAGRAPGDDLDIDPPQNMKKLSFLFG